MKAIILAGGRGTRLASVTGGSIPKPMAPIAGKSVLEYLLVTLRENGFTELCLALRTLPEAITDYFGSGERFGVHLSYRIEAVPRGTAGALTECRDFVGDEPFLVCSGDALLDSDLTPLLQLQRSTGAAAVLGLWEQAEPLSFGLCLTDRLGRVRAFVEKPAWGQVVTDLVNTGIYVFSPRVFSFIPGEGAYDIGGELLPALLDAGEPLYARKLNGYWRDIGEPESYYQANLDVLSGRLPRFAPPAPVPAEPPRRRYPCAVTVKSRDCARLMRTLSALFMESGADFTDGLDVPGLHIAPRCAGELQVEAGDAPTAERYAQLCRELEETGE
ncbi:MAG: nucleotidyltransferase family protein [Clostridiales bacterium]|nr:nucleotidyltransferase family protein [Candidatus Apopatocola equi]